MTPVHVAAAWGQEMLLRLLLASGGDSQLFDDDGLTPLDYAVRENHEQVVELLTNYSVPHETQDISNISLQLGNYYNIAHAIAIYLVIQY